MGIVTILGLSPALRFITVVTLTFVFSSCGRMSPEVQFVKQKIPIKIETGKPITVKISLSGNGMNDVGIRCPLDIWNTLTNNGPESITVKLKSSSKPSTEIAGLGPGSNGTAFLSYVSDVHYLFYIHGEEDATALVELTFSNTPSGVTSAEIIVGKTPADTGP